MNETPTVRALIELEDSRPDAVFSKVPGSNSYLWPLARWPIAYALASANLGVTTHSTSVRTSRLYYLKRMVREAIPNPRSSDRLHEPIDCLFIASGETRTTAPKGTGNWLTDDFATGLGIRAAVVQDLNFDLFTRRHDWPANPRTWTWAPADARIRNHAETQPISAAAKNEIAEHMQNVYARLGNILPHERQQSLTQEVINRVNRLLRSDSEFITLLERTQPKHIIMDGASYGHRSNFIRIAHERGISVSELQHGWIGASHAAYNYGRAWFDSPLTSSLPDTLLTFGDYWGEQLRFPGTIVPVGKPLLEQAIAAAAPYSMRKKRLLIVSSDYERDRLITVASMLRQLLPEDWEVSLRPHPVERADAETLFADALAAGVIIDQILDVNASIASSRCVVGMVSTVLFEALPISVHIGVIETDLADFYADAEIFPRRLNDDASFNRLASLLVSGEAPSAEVARSIWHPHPVETFLKKFRPES